MADNSYGAQVYMKQGAAEMVVASGGTLTMESGAVRTVAGASVADNVTFAAAAGSSNIANVTLTVTDGAGVAIASPFLLDVWLSDSATGVGQTATTASGTVTAKSASGVVWTTPTAKKALQVQTLGTGVFVLEITDTAKTGFYVCTRVPGTGKTVVSSQLITANYG